jgi:DNA polymerase III subunit beta
MQLNVKALKDELSWVARFLEGTRTIPILSNVLFSADANKLTLAATDLEVSGITTLEGIGKGKWSAAIPVKKLIQYLGKVDEPEVSISGSNDFTVSVVHGANSTKINGMSPESFPCLPEFPDTQVTLRGLALAITRTQFCISKEESRFTLTGALLEIANGKAVLAATDGHRLGVAPLQAINQFAPIKALIPKFALLEAGKFETDCAFALDDARAFMSWGQRRIVTRKLAGNFPEYQRSLRADYLGHCMVPANSTLKALDRVAVCADERSRAVRFTLKDNKLTLYASTVDLGEAEAIVPVRPGEGGELEIGLNCEYVMEFLNVIGTQFASLAYVDKKTQVELGTGDGYRYVVMPMRLE